MSDFNLFAEKGSGMRIFKALLSVLLLGTGIATAASAQSASDRTVVAPRDGSPAIYQTGWGGGGSGDMVVVWSPSLQSDGRVAICGIWVVTNSFVERGARQVLQRATVRVNGQVAKRNLGQLAKSPSIGELRNTPPACVLTDARGQWQEVSVTFGDGSFRN